MAIGNYSHSRLLSLIKTQHAQENASDSDPAGLDTHLQYNNNGNFGGISTFTFDGTDMKVADDTKINTIVDNIKKNIDNSGDKKNNSKNNANMKETRKLLEEISMSNLAGFAKKQGINV